MKKVFLSMVLLSSLSLFGVENVSVDDFFESLSKEDQAAMLKVMRDKVDKKQRFLNDEYKEYPELFRKYVLSNEEKEQIEKEVPSDLTEKDAIEWCICTSDRAEMNLRVYRLGLLEAFGDECMENNSEDCRILMDHIKLFTQCLKNKESKQRANS